MSQILNKFPTNTNTDLHFAAKNYDYAALKEQLEQGKDVNETDFKKETPLHVLLEDGVRGHLNMESLVACLILLIKCGADVNVKSHRGKSPLYLASVNRFPLCANILIENGAELTEKVLLHDSRLFMPTTLALTMPEVILRVFDNCVTAGTSGNESTIRLNWCGILQYKQNGYIGENHRGLLKRAKDQMESSFLYNLLDGDKNNQRKLLTHPLVTTFINLKFSKIQRHLWLFFIAVIFFPVVYLVFIYYLYLEVCGPEEFNSTTTVNIINQDENEEITTEMYPEQNCKITQTITICGYCLLGFLSCWSALQVYLVLIRFDWKYIKSWRTWVEIFAIVCMIATLWPALQLNDVVTSINFQYPIASLGMFSAWVVFLLQIGSIPWFVVYLEVLAKILIGVLKVYLLFLPLLVGFYMGFSLMFAERVGVFHFIIMMLDIGSSEYEQDILEHKKGSGFWFTMTAYVFCVGFIITIVIVFMNFVLGTAIKDIQKMAHDAKLTVISQRIQNVYIVDLMLGRYFHLVGPSQLKTGEVFYDVHPNDPTCPVPPDVVKKLIAIINERKRKSKDELSTIYNSERTTMNKNDFSKTNDDDSDTEKEMDNKFHLLNQRMDDLMQKLNDIGDKIDD